MNNIVVYNSKTGFTKQYAEWIAEALSCKAVNIKDAAHASLGNYDSIIFGGWIMGNMITCLDKVKPYVSNKLTVFAVGSGPDTLTDIAAIKNVNHLTDEPIFYMQGGFRYKELNFMMRGMLKMVKKQAMKKPDPTASDKFMAEKLGTSFDCSNKDFINPLVDYIHAL